jgi:hypothetical protein
MFRGFFPALARWARLFRAYGACLGAGMGWRRWSGGKSGPPRKAGPTDQEGITYLGRIQEGGIKPPLREEEGARLRRERRGYGGLAFAGLLEAGATMELVV